MLSQFSGAFCHLSWLELGILRVCTVFFDHLDQKLISYILLFQFEEEAKKIGFRGEFGRSHVAISPAPPPVESEDERLAALHDDDDEDIHLEIQKQFNDKMQSILV